MESAWSGRAQATGFRAEGAAEVLEALAEADEGAGLGAVGPKRPGEPGALDRAAGAQREEGEEPIAFAGAQPRQKVAVHPRLERPEELQKQRWCRADRLGDA